MNVDLVSLFNARSFPVRTLEACLAEKGIHTTSIFFKDGSLEGMPPFSDNEIDTMVSLILSESPDLIGISLRTIFYHHAVRLTSYLKKNTDTPVVWGGTHAIICPELCVAHADIVCIGEGENTILKICERLDNKDSLEGVDNIFFRREGNIIENDLSPLIANLDEIPVPIIGNREGIRKIYYDGGKIFHEDPLIVQNSIFYDFMSARGCPFNC